MKNLSLVSFPVTAILFFSLPILSCRGTAGPQITAHRGASAYAPENTLAAFRKALEFGADAAELDVRLTGDGNLVLMHDKFLKRTTGAEGNVWEYTLAELKELDAGAWFGPSFQGEPIPTLDEVIRLVKGRMKLNIEVKTSEDQPQDTAAVAGAVVAVIRGEGFERDCVVTSFDRAVVEEIERTAPDLVTGFIFGEKHPEDIFEGPWDLVSAYQSLATEDFIRRARASWKGVHVWTVDNPDRMRELAALGVDSIITNKPDVARRILRRR